MEKLKRDLMQLLELQHAALNRTPYLRLTAKEAIEIEQRTEQIRVLLAQLQNKNDSKS